MAVLPMNLSDIDLARVKEEARRQYLPHTVFARSIILRRLDELEASRKSNRKE